MVGRVGIPASDFWNLTPHDTMIIFKSWAEQQNLNQQNEWERIRWQTGCLYNLQVKRSQQKTPAQWFKLPWDAEQKKHNKPESPPSTKERFDELKTKWAKTNGRK